MTEFNESAREIIERHIESQWNCAPLSEWSAADIVSLIRLMDAELQTRSGDEAAAQEEADKWLVKGPLDEYEDSCEETGYGC